MRADLASLLRQPIVRTVFIATSLGYAAYSLINLLVGGFVIDPYAIAAHPDSDALNLIRLDYYVGELAHVAGRSVDWTRPLSAAIELALVAGAVRLVTRWSR